ncbi:MAG: HD domain-containing protein [Cyanobacteria bacterium HKST-UBA04]|nr:HD domain-containing protein [Cyanobacteria bacterium HKST-UBA04]
MQPANKRWGGKQAMVEPVTHAIMPDATDHLVDGLLKRLDCEPAYVALRQTSQAQGVSWLMLVGGMLRDWVLRETVSADLDVVVDPAHAKPLAKALSKVYGCKCIVLDEALGIYRLVVPPTFFETNGLQGRVVMIDVAARLGNTLADDLARRDLTVNAMGLTLDDAHWHDPYDGLGDAQRRQLRMVSADNFRDDPLRYIRLFRFAATLGGLAMEAGTLVEVRAEGHRLLHVAPERIHYELCRLLDAEQCFDVIGLMQQTGLLGHLFVEWPALQQVPANGYHHLALPEHTLALLQQLEQLWAGLPASMRGALAEPYNATMSRRAVCRLGCFFHDFGKPATMALDDETGRYRFYGHEKVGAELVAGIALRYRWSQQLTRDVCALTRWHLYPHQVMGPEVSDKARHKFFRRLTHVMPELLALALCDRHSTRGTLVSQADVDRDEAQLLALWAAYEVFAKAEAELPPLLSGREVMARLNLQPGPAVGRVLDQLREAQLAGELADKASAEVWLDALQDHVN